MDEKSLIKVWLKRAEAQVQKFVAYIPDLVYTTYEQDPFKTYTG